MDRNLLSKILTLMKQYLKEGKSIGDLKLGSLLALGHQLEAIFYYLGHELGTTLEAKKCEEVVKIPEELKKLVLEYNIGEILIKEATDEIITLNLKNHSSTRDLIGKGIKSGGNFCSFEAGMLAGIVERMTNIHCFAQELNCSMQTGEDSCEFMIVFQND
jgi:predicted hydrocarbon binding protein